MKPRITKIKGATGYTYPWVCVGSFGHRTRRAIGYGKTPSDAFKAWSRDVARYEAIAREEGRARQFPASL